MEINENIKSKFETIGEDYDSLKPYMKEYLMKIESKINEKTSFQKKILRELKENMFSISSISKEIGCSRTTLYNHNQLLKRYIEHSEKIFGQESPFYVNDNLKNSNRKLREQISLMEGRDINMEILKQEKAQLSNTLKEKNKEIKRLQNRVNELSYELQAKQKEHNKPPAKVSPINEKQ